MIRYCLTCGLEAERKATHFADLTLYCWCCPQGHKRDTAVRHPWKVVDGTVTHRGTGDVLGRVKEARKYASFPEWYAFDAEDDHKVGHVHRTRTAACRALWRRRYPGGWKS